jgi:hypothetical protein
MAFMVFANIVVLPFLLNHVKIVGISNLRMIRVFSSCRRAHIGCANRHRKSLNRVANVSILRNKSAATAACAYTSLERRIMRACNRVDSRWMRFVESH